MHVVADLGLADWRAWPAAGQRPDSGEFPAQCCTHVYPGGCTARLVCHGTPAAAAARILADGALRCAAAASTWGEPPDYFEHVMLANGRCTAPEAVAASRASGQDLVPADLKPGYVPAVRFYFSWLALARLPGARFDGVHPVKLHHELRLDGVLVAVVVHASQLHLVAAAAGRFSNRLAVISIERPSPQSWATQPSRHASDGAIRHPSPPPPTVTRGQCALRARSRRSARSRRWAGFAIAAAGTGRSE